MLRTRLSHSLLSMLVAVCWLSAPATADPTRLGGPVSGYVFDASSGSIRPIVGLPGASYLGDALVAGLEWAAVAPDGKLVLALREGGLFVVRGLESAAPEWTPVEGALKPERAVWGADGSAAVSAGSRVQILRNLAGTPSADPAAEIDAPVTALVVAGTEAIAGVDGGLYLVSAGEAPRLLAAVERPVALAVSRDGSDLYVADAASGKVFQAPGFRDGANLLALDGDLADPVGLAVSADGRLFVAGKASKALGVFDLASRILAERIELDFEPTCFEALSAQPLFLLKSAGRKDEPLLILTAGQSPAVFFVPAGRGE